MKPKHECGEELCTMRYLEYSSKLKKTLMKEPIDDKSECMWCPACKKAVSVEVMHA